MKFVDIDSLNKRKVDKNDVSDDWKEFYGEYSSPDKDIDITLVHMFIKAVVKDEEGNPIIYDSNRYYAPGSYTVDPMLRDALILRDNTYIRTYYFNNPKEPNENI